MDINKRSANSPRPNEVETLGPVSVNRKSKIPTKRIFKSVLVLAVLVGLAGSGYLLKQEKDKSSSLNNQVNSLNGEVTSLKEQINGPENGQSEGIKETSGVTLPVIVFEPEGIFTDEEKDELNKKLVNPMVDYSPGDYVSIHIEIFSQDKFVGGPTDDKYIVTTIRKPGEGGSGGFLYGSKQKGLEFWTPTCLNDCEFSDEYKSKYPEVIQKYESTNP